MHFWTGRSSIIPNTRKFPAGAFWGGKRASQGTTVGPVRAHFYVFQSSIELIRMFSLPMVHDVRCDGFRVMQGSLACVSMCILFRLRSRFPSHTCSAPFAAALRSIGRDNLKVWGKETKADFGLRVCSRLGRRPTRCYVAQRWRANNTTSVGRPICWFCTRPL